MKTILAFILIILSLRGFSQEKRKLIKPTKDDIDFIHSFFFDILDSREEKTYQYQSAISTFKLEERLATFALDTIADLGSYKNKTIIKGKPILILRPEEKAFVRIELLNLESLKWEKKLIPGENRLTMVKSGSDGYMITKPIFIRNNSLCIFEFSHFCGSRCGDGLAAVFRKIDGKWEVWLVVSRWYS